MAQPTAVNPDEVERLIMPENRAVFDRLSPEEQAAFLKKEGVREAALRQHLADQGLA